MAKFLAGVAVTALVLAGTAIALIFSGIYNVAAVQSLHPGLAWILRTTMENSVHRQATSIVPPQDFATRAAEGFQDFDDMCVQCHGAPGRERSEIGEGLAPQPPNLQNAAQAWTPSEVFWIVKNGVHMTGMPAFGPTHDDQRLWAIVAFVKSLPGMTAERYNQLGGRFPPGGQRGPSGHPGHDHQ
ncbi:hypothetical protein ES707_05828 [subsurface metagenome]